MFSREYRNSRNSRNSENTENMIPSKLDSGTLSMMEIMFLWEFIAEGLNDSIRSKNFIWTSKSPCSSPFSLGLLHFCLKFFPPPPPLFSSSPVSSLPPPISSALSSPPSFSLNATEGDYKRRFFLQVATMGFPQMATCCKGGNCAMI